MTKPPSAWIRPLDDKERKKLGKHVDQATKTLAELGLSDAVEAATKHRADLAADPKRREPLAWLWMKLMAERSPWKLAAWAWSKGGRIMLFSPDWQSAIDGVHMFAIGPTTTHDLGDDYLQVLTSLFMKGELADHERSRLIGCGIVKPAGQLPVREA